MANPPKITIDFETRSALDIKRGAWLYSLHPSTEVMCLAYKIGDATTRLWHPGYAHLSIEESPPPEDLFEAIQSGMLVEAHNRFFEFCIWTHHMIPLWGWPEIREEQWRCSAAKASYYSLPRALEDAVKALGLPIQKDMEGSKVMKKLAKPRKLRKAERQKYREMGLDPDEVIVFHESVEDFERNWAYCVTDVDAEHGFSEALPDLPEYELRVWQMDQRMNLRGVHCDLELVRKAKKIREREIDLLNADLRDLTGGAVERGSNRAAAKEWLASVGVDLPDTQGATLDEMLKPERVSALPRNAASVLKIVREVNRSSTAKYDTMEERADPHDHRLRDLMMYHGASTGRWTGKGVQPHNFPRGTLDIKDMELLCEILSTMDRATIVALAGEPMAALSDALRGMLTASRGKLLAVADFAAIEARVVFWLARDQTALGVFEAGLDIYMDLATGIYGYPVTDKKKQAQERQFGKQGILGLGFEMGFVTFLLNGVRKYDIKFSEEQCRAIVGDRYADIEDAILKYFKTDKRRQLRLTMEGEPDHTLIMHELVLMKYTVDTYRARYPAVTQMWRDQEESALAAIRSPGRIVDCERGRNSWVVEQVGDAGPFLVTYLPSGKPLFYQDPRIIRKKAPWKDRNGNPVFKECISFMGPPAKGKGWVRQDTYGGKLVENITQATARELMAGAMLRADEHPDYDVLLSVHDELICEALPEKANVREFEQLMAKTPGWAHGCPVDAEGWVGFRYRK